MKPDERRLRLGGLTPELFLLIVLPLAGLLLLVTFGGVALHQRGMREMVGERDERAARASARSLAGQLAARLEAVQGLARNAPPDALPGAPDLAERLQANAFLLSDFGAGLAFYSPGGQRLAAVGPPAAWEALERQTPGWPPAPGRAWLSPVVWLEEKPLLFAVAGNAAGDLLAVGAFSPARLADQTLGDLLTGPPASDHSAHSANGEIFLVDEHKRVIYRSGAVLNSFGLELHPGVDEALSGQSGSMFMGSRQEHVAAYSPVALPGKPVYWALMVEEPWESVSSPMLRLTEYAPLVLLPLVVISTLALWFGTHRIVEPLRALQARAARLGWGDYAAIEAPVGGIDEIRQLQGELAHLARKVQAAQQGLRDYIGAMTAGQEEERRRLARELHDDTLQTLIALNQRVQLLQLKLDQTAGCELAQEAAGLQALAADTIRNLRRLTRALRPLYLEDLGLAPALEMLAREMSQPGLEIAFEQHGAAYRLAPLIELALYRMAQEALSNVVRHAQASQARLTVEFAPRQVAVQVSDNGRGFTLPGGPAAFTPGGHFGLLGLHERAEMIGAQLAIRSQPGQGTLVRVEVEIYSPSHS